MERSLTARAHAKINWTLDILGRRPDGYHEVELICQSITLHDDVAVAVRDADAFSVRCVADAPDIPDGSDNIAAKAAYAFAARTGLRAAVDIGIRKRVPHAAGLGGGSADAAAVLRALDRLCGTRLGDAVLRDIAAGIGADVPFCVSGGAAVCRGIGAELAALSAPRRIALVIVKPPESVSTAWAYRAFDAAARGPRPDTAGAAAALERGDVPGLAARLRNVLEDVSIPAHPSIAAARAALTEAGALGALMTGSGSAVFGVFADAKAASYAHARIGARHEWSAVAETIESLEGPG